MIATTREELAEKLAALFRKYPVGARYGAQYAAEFANALIEVTEEPLSDVPPLALTPVAVSGAVAEVVNIVVATVIQAEETHIRIPANIEAEDLEGKTLILWDDAGSVGFWFDIDDSGALIPTDATACTRAVEVTTLVRNENNAEIAAKLITAIGADADFSAAAHIDDNALIVTEAQGTVQEFPGDANDTGFYVVREQQGMLGGIYINGKGIILYDAAGSVGIWIDTDNDDTTIPDWATACNRAIEITSVTGAMTADQIAAALRTDIAVDAAFGTAGATNNCEVTLAATGAVDLAMDQDAGFTLTRTAEGSSAIEPAADALNFRLAQIEQKINDMITAQSV